MTYIFVYIQKCRRVDSFPKHVDTFRGAPLRLPKPLSDQYPVRVLVSPLCVNRL